MRLSISKVQEYDKCPHSYKLTNIDKLKPSRIPIQLKEGIQKHRIFDKVFDVVKENDIEKLKEEIKKIPNYSQYESDCNNFVKYCEMIKEKSGIFQPKHREIKLFNEELNVSGIIDRVDFVDDSVLILDYKTGKEHPIEEYYLQLGTYVYLFEKKFGTKVTHWGILFTKPGIFTQEKVKRHWMDMAKQKIEMTRGLITLAMENDHFPKNPGPLCNWCTWKQEGVCDGK